MDFEQLLAKYMQHIIDQEGLSFIDRYDPEVDITEEEHRKGFTHQEWSYLLALSGQSLPKPRSG